jgi:uncharacterized repeat protein (TIGR01451 family)
MTNKLKVLAGASGLVIAAMGVTPAMAAGTASGSTISNTATVNYQVGGVGQTPITTLANVITVDRKINLTVVEIGAATTFVSPGQTSTTPANSAISTFTVTNNSNATIDIGLSVAQLAGVAAPFAGGSDNFNFTNVRMYIDNPLTGTVGSYDAGDALAIYVDELAADATRRIFVVVDIPATQVNNDIAAFSLTGTAKESGVAATEGAVITATAGANTAGVDTVLADAQGSDDAATPDGKHSARDDFKVSAATLTVAKLSRVIEDPINTIASGTAANAKMIPGATIEYCITVTNGAGAAATSVNIGDTLPAEVTYLAAFGIWEGGTVASSICSGGTNTGVFTAPAGPPITPSGSVSGTLGTVATSTTKTLYFRAKIN